MQESIRHPIVNIADVELHQLPAEFSPTGPAAERYASRLGFVGQQIGARLLGYNITVVPPGKRAFPRHNHQINEEMFLVLEGTGQIRIGGAVHAIKPGDMIACPPGGQETAHQIINNGEVELRFLAISTKLSPEIVEYPDSGKFGVLAENLHGKGPLWRFVGQESAGVDYWEGE